MCLWRALWCANGASLEIMRVSVTLIAYTMEGWTLIKFTASLSPDPGGEGDKPLLLRVAVRDKRRSRRCWRVADETSRIANLYDTRVHIVYNDYACLSRINSRDNVLRSCSIQTRSCLISSALEPLKETAIVPPVNDDLLSLVRLSY